MKKFLLTTILVGFVLTVGFVWVDSTLTVAGGECYCQSFLDAGYACQDKCYTLYGEYCSQVYPDATGDCVSGTCFTRVYYKCTNNMSGYLHIQYPNCQDCN